MKKWIGVIAVVALLLLIVNDLGRSARAVYDLNTQARLVASAGASQARGLTAGTVTGIGPARKTAATFGIDLVAYSATRNGVQVTVRTQVPGTWVIGPYIAWRAGQPLSTPFEIQAAEQGNFY